MEYSCKLLILGLVLIGFCGIADSIEYVSAKVSHILFKDETSDKCEGVKLSIQGVLPPQQFETVNCELCRKLTLFCCF
jgi:hypothetical protein